MNKLTISYNDQNIITTSAPNAYTLSTEGKLLSNDIKVVLEKGTPSTLNTSINTSTTGLITATTTETENFKIINTKTSTSQLTLYDLEVSPTPSLEDAGWAFISKASSEGVAQNYWEVGDMKSICLLGTCGSLSLVDEVLYCYILEFDHNAEVEGQGITFGTWKTASGIDVALVDDYYTTNKSDGTKCFNMNHWGHDDGTQAQRNGNYGGWKGCDLRYDILGSTDVPPVGYDECVADLINNAEVFFRYGYDASVYTAKEPVPNTLMSCLPNDLRQVMKPIAKYTDNVGGGQNSNNESIQENVTISIDYLPLLAISEINRSEHNTLYYCNSYEPDVQTRYSYYTIMESQYTGSDPRSIYFKTNFKKLNENVFWSLRSPNKIGPGGFNAIGLSSESTGIVGTWLSSVPRGLAPIFLV